MVKTLDAVTPLFRFYAFVTPFTKVEIGSNENIRNHLINAPAVHLVKKFLVKSIYD